MASGGLLGYKVSRKYSQHIAFLREYMDLILIFKTEIKHTQKPLLKILKDYSRKNILSKYIDKCLELSKKYDFKSAWRESFSDLNSDLGITEEEENIIKNFGMNLGSSDIKSQIEFCNYNFSVTEIYFKKLLENKNHKEKLPVKLALCAGLALCIIIF